MYKNGYTTASREISGGEKRVNFLVVFILLVTVVFIYQLFAKSVLDHASITVLANDQYIVEQEISSSRGIIYAKDKNEISGVYPLALNDERYQVSVVPKNVIDKKETANKLAEVLDLDSEELFDQINNDNLYLPPIKSKLTKNKADEILALDLDGILVSSQEIRLYPEEDLASQVLGFVDAEGIGRYGLEGYYNDELTGLNGEVIAEQDILGRLISIDDMINAEDGSNLYTTIDRNVQYISEKYLSETIEKMEAESGSILVLDPSTGKIISMVSSPDFDPNNYSKTAEEHADYFVNPIVSSAWEPGSIMKPVVMGMALDMGKVDPDTTEEFGDNVWVDGYEIRNARDEAFGKEDMSQVLQNSDNVGMVWVSGKMSNEEMYGYFERLGFGSATLIDLQAEATGNLLDIENWGEIHRATMSFGQGISTTPLQMAMSFAAIANDGVLVKPYVVEKVERASGEIIEYPTEEVGRIFSHETSEKLKNMLISVIDKGHASVAGVDGYSIAGKTGTAQIPDDTGGYMEGEYIHSFCGFFPADDPKYVALVILEKPQKYNFAATTTAPVFGNIAKWLLNYSQIEPTR